MKYNSFDYFFQLCKKKNLTHTTHSAHRLYKNRPAGYRLPNLTLNSGKCGKPALQLRKLAQGITECLVQGQRILDLSSQCLLQFHRVPSHSTGPQIQIQAPHPRSRPLSAPSALLGHDDRRFQPCVLCRYENRCPSAEHYQGTFETLTKSYSLPRLLAPLLATFCPFSGE